MEDFPSQHDMMYGQFACGAWSDDLLDFHAGSSDLDSQTWSSYMRSDFHVEQFWQNLDAGISTWSSQPDFQWFLQAEVGEGCSECTPTVLSDVDQDEECGNRFIQQQINEFFQLGVGAADVRVEELADGSSGVLQGTKRVGGHGKDWRRSKEHHTYVVKRSLQRARKRAMQHGSTLYRGKRLTCQELGRPCDHYTAEVMQLGRRRTVHLRDEGKLDQILPAWPPTVGPLTEAQTHPPKPGQIGILSVNLGGFSKEGYDEFQQWAHTSTVVEHVHILFLQETWRPSSEFSSDAWHWVQSGTQKSKNQGVAVLINKSLAAASSIRFTEVIKGRLLKVLIPADPSHHLRRRPITLFCVYQHARVSEQQVVYENRDKVWDKINHALASVPRRHLLIAAGDWNTPLLSDAHHVGPGVLEPKWLPADHARFASLLRTHGLCALNTWRSSSQAATFVGPPETSKPQVRTQIDFILARSHQAGGTGRAAATVPHVEFASWRRGTKHLPVAVVLEDNRVECVAKRNKPQIGHCRDRLITELQSAEVHAQFQTAVTTAVEALDLDSDLPERLDAALLQIVDVMFPKETVLQPKPWQTQEVKLTLRHVWEERRVLMLMERKMMAVDNLSGLLAVWRQWTRFHKARKLLRKTSVGARRQKWDDSLHTAEEALRCGNSHLFYATVKKMAPRGEQGRVQLRSHSGDVLTAEEELEVMHKHWKGVFDLRTMPEQVWELQEGMDIKVEEVRAAMKALSLRKATMPGTAPSAAWKFGGDLLINKIHAYLQERWGPGILAHDTHLTQSWLHFLRKPGRTLRDPSDLRPIALQPGACKIFSHVMKRRLQPFVEELALRYPQFAYVPGRGTLEAISLVADHCDRVRAAVRAQRMDLHSKHAGVQQAPCSGGCQLSVDMSRAFDSVPRQSLCDALCWACVPPDLVALLMSWHEQSVYLLGQRHDPQLRRYINVTRGVKQGCLIAPSLWFIYSCYVWSQIDGAAGTAWTADHTTGYADDFHFRWELGSFRECKQVGQDIDMIFRILQQFGLQVNPAKSSFLVEVRGADADRWLRKHRVKAAEAGKWNFRYNMFTKGEVPICKSFKYLGVILSYHGYEDQTIAYRLDLAQSHRNRLAKVLQGRGGLGLSQRRRTWLTCVQTAQVYGLCATGITSKGLQQLYVQSMKHIRAFAKSPRHITQESDADLLRRLEVPHPLDHLLRQVDNMLERHSAQARLQCYDVAAVLGRLQRLRCDLVNMQESRQDVRKAVGPPVLRELPHTTPQFACQVCGQAFPTLHQLKTHEGRQHKLTAPRRTIGNKADYSLDGLPTCKLCRQKFSRWRGLQRHIRENRCPELRAEPVARSALDGIEASSTLGTGNAAGEQAWRAPAEVAGSILQPVIQWESVLALPAPRRWERIVKLPQVAEHLKNRCGLCDQWVAKANGMRKHYRSVHSAEWQQHESTIKHWARSWSKVITRPCPVCGVEVADVRQHAGSCVVMFQAAMIQLSLTRSCSGDGGLFQAHARDSCDGGRGGTPVAGAPQKEEAGGGQQEGTFKGQGQGKGQRQAASQSSDQGLRRFFGPSRVGQAPWPHGPQTSGGPESTGVRHLFPSHAGNQATSRDGDSKPLQGCRQLAQAERGESCSAAADPSAGDADMFDQRGSGQGGAHAEDPECQEGGGTLGIPGRRRLGLSGLGSGKAAQCAGHSQEADSPSRLPRTGGEDAQVCHGDRADKISGSQDTHHGPGRPANPFPPGCFSEGLVPPRCAFSVDSVVGVQPGGGKDPEIAHQAEPAAGAALPNASQSMTWILRAVLGNTASFCYANSVFLALAAMWDESCGDSLVCRMLRKIKGSPGHLLHLCKQGEWRELTRQWQDPQRQHDAAEFLLHLVQVDAELCHLSSWKVVNSALSRLEGIPRDLGGRGCILVPTRNAAGVSYLTLQDCIQAWHEQMLLHVLDAGAMYAVIQLDRFIRHGPFVRKDLAPISHNEGRLLLPVLGDDDDFRWCPYTIRSIVLHIGPTSVSGHYRMAYFDAGGMSITDDNRPPEKVSLSDRLEERAYMFFLRRE